MEFSVLGRIDCIEIFVGLATGVEEANSVGAVAGTGVVELVGTREAVVVTRTVGGTAGKSVEVGGTNAKNGIFI